MAQIGATVVWLRRDLRLADHPALSAAAARGGPVIPLFVWDETMAAGYGAAPQWRLSRSLASLTHEMAQMGARLILRSGPALETLRAVIAESGADAVFWSRLYDAPSIERDKVVKASLRTDGVTAESFEGALLFEPFRVRTKTGDFYKVYTPFWRACRALESPPAPLPTPGRLPPPVQQPDSLSLADLALETPMNRGAGTLTRHVAIGEEAARVRLDAFLDQGVADYGGERDRLDRDGTSRLSAHLAVGEISPRQIWHAAEAKTAATPEAEAGAEVFLKEIVWREFAAHLSYHTPRLLTDNWRPQWDAFPWRDDNADAEAWRRGRTGVPVIDAAMRELYVTGTMHNRARMLVASYLTKNLLTHWRVGEAWFRDCLVDWDPASNAMGWQWAAGSGPDAAPYFRIFNPETQAAKFDPDGSYVRCWLPEARGAGSLLGQADAANPPRGLDFFDACPRIWDLSPDDPYPEPAHGLAEGRARALDAYASLPKANAPVA
ncbi:MAG: DNA photolyase family protein [Rhodobacteraceae bacterium]|nr:DNA photolyase family protein [Paracoccaceae bacterium]